MTTNNTMPEVKPKSWWRKETITFTKDELEQRAKVAAEMVSRRMDEFDDYSDSELESIILAAMKEDKV